MQPYFKVLSEEEVRQKAERLARMWSGGILFSPPLVNKKKKEKEEYGTDDEEIDHIASPTQIRRFFFSFFLFSFFFSFLSFLYFSLSFFFSPLFFSPNNNKKGETS